MIGGNTAAHQELTIPRRPDVKVTRSTYVAVILFALSALSRLSHWHDPSRRPVMTGGRRDGRYFLAAVLTAVLAAVTTAVKRLPSMQKYWLLLVSKYIVTELKYIDIAKKLTRLQVPDCPDKPKCFPMLTLAAFMAALWNRAGHYIFALRFLSSSFFPLLISAVGDWMSTMLPHMVWP